MPLLRHRTSLKDRQLFEVQDRHQRRGGGSAPALEPEHKTGRQDETGEGDAARKSVTSSVEPSNTGPRQSPPPESRADRQLPVTSSGGSNSKVADLKRHT